MGGKYDGGCLCGQVRFHCEGEPQFSGNCHCKDCQRASGGSFTPAMMFPRAAVTVTGSPKFFRSRGESGRGIERGFCAECGSPMFTRLEAFPEVLIVRAGVLDDPSTFQPMLDFYVASAPHWDHMNPELPKRPGSPRD
jgi:hypothetical protein